MNVYMDVVINCFRSVINKYRIGVLLVLIFSPVTSAAVLEFDRDTDYIDEGWGAYTFTVTKDNTGFVSSVGYTISGTAIAGSDYSGATSGILNWSLSDGEDKTFTINILDDALVESDETIVVTLNSPTNGDTLGAINSIVVTVGDNEDPLQFLAASYSVDEAAGSILVSVNRPRGGSAPASVSYNTVSGTATAGTDFTASSGTVSWGVGDSAPSKSFSIAITDDMNFESNETFSVVLSNPMNGSSLGTPSTTLITINNDDAYIDSVNFTTGAFSFGEKSGNASVDVERTGSGIGSAKISYATEDDTAIASTGDYRAKTGTLTWLDGELGIKSISVYILPDDLVEGPEAFKIVLSNAIGNIVLDSVIETTVTIGDESQNIAETPNLSDNQRGTAGVIDNECSAFNKNPRTSSVEEDFKALCNRLRDINTTDAEIKAALDAINPEELTKMGAVSRQIGGLQHQNIESRFSVLHRSGGGGIDLSGLNLNVDGQEMQGAVLASMLESYLGGGASGDNFSRWGLFANGNLKFGDKDSTDTNGGYDFDMLALTIGIDYRFTDDLVVGASVGYGVADIDYSDDAGGMDTASWSGTVYASYYLSEYWYVDGLMNYAQDDYDSKRRILYTDSGGTVDRTASGSSVGDQLSFGINSGYDFHLDAWVFGPHFSSYYLNVNVGKLQETGAGGWNTIVSSNQSQSFTASGGAHVSYTFTPSWGVIRPYARFDLVHEFYDDPETLQMRFAVSSDIIEISTDRLESDYANIGLGVSAQFKHGMSGFIDYQTTAGYSGFSIHDVSMGMRLERSF